MDIKMIGLIGIYVRENKPADANKFFQSLVNEYSEITAKKGISYNNRIIPLKIRAFIGDAVCRGFMLGHKSVRSRKPCSKCHVIGTNYIARRKRRIKNIWHMLENHMLKELIRNI